MNFKIGLGGLALLISSLSYATQFALMISGGPNFSTLKNEELVQINQQVTNRYQTNLNTNWKGFVGGGIEHTFEKYGFTSFSLGVAGYGFNLGSIQGVEFPFVTAGSFDTLNYSFNVKSFALLVESRLTYEAYHWQPFFSVGIGPSWNKSENYKEVPTNAFSSAAPVSPGFSDHTQTAFAYTLGIGIQKQFWEDQFHNPFLASIGYRYFNLGRSELGSFPAQTASSYLQINRLYTQGIIFSIRKLFN